MSIHEQMMQEQLDAELEAVAESQQRPEMTEGEILNAIDQEIRWSTDLLLDDLAGNRTNAWHYFEGKAPTTLDKDVPEYFQNIVSRDVADSIEAALAEILPAFATDRPATFDAVGPEDADQAALESDICNDILMESGAGYLQLLTAAKNAFLLRAGFLEIDWKDYLDMQYREAEVSPQELALLMETSEIEIREIEHAGVVDMQTGKERIHVEIRHRQRIRKIHIEAPPVDEMLISSDCESVILDEARFVARQTLTSRSELIAAGYDRELVESLQAFTVTTAKRSTSARQRNTWGRERRSGDPGMDLVQVVRCYYRLDEDRDGIAERRKIVVAGNPGGWRLLSDEPVDYQPFAAGIAYLWPHQPFGMSFYDKLKSVQDLKSKNWRILLAAGQRSARDRLGILNGTKIDDIQHSEFGGFVRMATKEGVVPIPPPRFPAELHQLQEMADKARREGGGGSVDKANAESMPVEAGAHGVERMLTAIEELNGAVAKLLAETLVQEAYKIIHHVLRTYSPPIPREVNGQWVMVDPSQWQPRTKISTSVGLTLAERGRLSGALERIIQRQMALLEKGSTLTDEVALYRALMAQARMQGISSPDGYFTDPRSPEGQQAAQIRAQQQQQQQMEAQQQQAMAAQLQAQSLAMVEQTRGQMRLQAEREKTQADLAKTLAKLQEDQRQFQETLAQNYDELRVKLVEIEAKYGETGEEPLKNE